MNSNLSLWILMIGFLSYPLSMYSWSITPTTTTIELSKPQTFFTISSEKNEKLIAIEITACRREINEMGEETTSEPTKDFLIYPSHIILKSDDTRTIRVVWKGSKELTEEKAYRLIATSLPVAVNAKGEDLQGEEIAINIAISTRYLNSLYVIPKNAKPNVQCAKTYIENKEEIGKTIVIELENIGNAHQYMNNFELKVQCEKEKLVIPKDVIKKYYGTGINLLAKHKRKLYIPASAITPNDTSNESNHPVIFSR